LRIRIEKSKGNVVSTLAVILPAAGKSSRFHDKHYKKPFIPLENRAVWLHAAEKFLNRNDVKQTILVISPEDREEFFSKFGANTAILGIEVVNGGSERTESVANALAHVKPNIDLVAVHDAARPCIANEWIDAVVSAAEKSGAAILALPVNGTLKRVASDHTIQETVSRQNLWEAQTPQIFRRELLIQAYANRSAPPATDDAELVERLGHPVTVVTGSPINLKITTKDDLRLAAQALKALPKPKTFGPAHPFADDDLWR
jgi:2-C-methyl-D-erythritol 4-phosphate cytidylyltransferase